MSDDTSKGSCPFPSYDVDFYDDDFIKSQYEHFRIMRDLGPVIWLPKNGNFAITRHAEVAQALLNWRVFSSAEGVAGDDFGCEFARGGTLTSDGPVHDQLRKISAAPLRPSALDSDRPAILKEAASLIDALVERGSFDGVFDLARHLPLTLVRDFVGLPDEASEHMLTFAAAGFDLLGCQNERGQAGLDMLAKLMPAMQMNLNPATLKPGSWAIKLFERVASGEMPPELVPAIMPDYLGPSLDTTISVTSQLIYHLGKNPEQWNKLREDPSLIPNAVLEGVRIASPVRSFTRTVTEDFEIGGVSLPKGARVMMLYACANRDERQFPNADCLEVTRDTTGHLGFGTGIHICEGQHLAQMEMQALLQAMVSRVEAIEVGEPSLALNNTIYGYGALPVRFTKAANTQAITRPAVVKDGWIDVRVAERIDAAQDIVSLVLEANDGGVLPAYEAGSHIDIKIGDGIVRQYSLCTAPEDQGRRYRLGVLREQKSRGGSAWVHEQLNTDDRFQISEPRNLFPLNHEAPNSLLVAGGIGITPILAMAYELKEAGSDFNVHYTARDLSRAAFVDEMVRAFGQQISVYADDERGAPKINLPNILAEADPRQHIYCCGPGGFIDYVLAEAFKAGWPESNIHVERFSGGEVNTEGSFKVIAKRSGLEISVADGETILQAVLDAGIDIPYSCETGICGTCACSVLEGTPDHQDSFQSDDEKATNKQITICCSRSTSETLVLDI